MRTQLIVLGIAGLLVSPAPAAAQEKTDKTAVSEKKQWETVEKVGRRDEFSLEEKARFSGAPVARARPGVIVSWILNISGLGLNLAGWFAASDPFIGLIEVGAGNTLMVAGSIVGTKSLYLRHESYCEAGFKPAKGYLYTALSMMSLTIVSYVGSFLFSLSESTTYMAFAMVIATPVIELFNAALVRTLWNGALLKSAVKNRRLSLMVSMTKDSSTDRPIPIFGLTGIL